MKAFAIFCLCMIALNSATSTNMMDKYSGMLNFSKKRSIMNVMAQVEAQLNANGPLDSITRILDEYDAEIRSEQLAHDQLYEKQTFECNDEFEFRAGEVEEANSALKEAGATLEGCQAQQVRAKADLTITKKQLKEKNAELINVHTVRRREKYAFDTAMGIFAIVAPAIDECLDYLEALFSGSASFAQITRHTNKMLINVAQLGKAHHMAPILSALAQVANSGRDVIADQELLNKLQGMFLTFKAKFEKENQTLIANEEAAIAKYNEDVARIEGIIANLQQQQADLENEISELDKCIITQQNIIASATQKRDRNQRLWDDAIKMCKAMDAQYESAKKGRAAELELLLAIQMKVEEHFAKLEGKGSVQTAGKLDNFDNTYENASATDGKTFENSN